MRRQPAEPIEAGGQDSFVDVVTNLVGILIVLVLIVGVRVKPAWRLSQAAEGKLAGTDPANLAADTKAAADKEADKQAAKDLAELEAEADGAKRDLDKTDGQVKLVDAELARQTVEQRQVATLIAAAENEIATRRAKLDDTARKQSDLKHQADGLVSDLQISEAELKRARAAPPPVAELRHYMTPLGRTVFGKEVHFRLADHRIAYLPMDELLQRAKSEVRSGEGTTPSDLTDHIHEAGPYGGFTLQFTMSLESGPERGQYTYSLKEAHFLPGPGQIGEPTDAALAPNSELHRRLNALDPQQFTVTIWVYPDSFSDYHRINDDLCRMGFAVAARPLPDGMPIGVSSHGSRSSAE